MLDLIDRPALLNKILDMMDKYQKFPYSWTSAFIVLAKVADIIDQCDSANEVPMNGRWIDNGVVDSMLSECSVCGFKCGAYSFNYCPDCGARMITKEDNNGNG